jgi:hypothetical protein
LAIIRKDRISIPLIDRIEIMEKLISNIAIRESKKSLEMIEENKLHMPLKSIIKNIGRNFKSK